MFHKLFGEDSTNQMISNIKCLGDLLVDKPKNGIFKMEASYGQGTPIVWVENISGYIINTSNLKRLEVSEEEKEQYLLKKGDIVVTRSSHIGSSGVGVMSVVESLLEDAVFESHIIRIRVNDQLVNPYFLAAYFRTNYCRNLIARIAKRSTMTTISQPDLLKVKVNLPTLDLQKKIEIGIKTAEHMLQNQLRSETQIRNLNNSLMSRLFVGKIDMNEDSAENLIKNSSEADKNLPQYGLDNFL